MCMKHAMLILICIGLPWYASTFTYSVSMHGRYDSLQIHHRSYHRFISINTIFSHVAEEDVFAGDFECNDSFHLYLRFSPLVGGPSFLPLHVELILVPVIEYNLNDRRQKKYTDIISTNKSFYIHRFDFLPENPRDQDTIVKLIQLQSVPANVRYRYCQSDQIIRCFQDANQDESAHFISDAMMQSKSMSILEDRGMTIALRIGTSSAVNNQSVLSSAISFVDSYRSEEGKELRILGGKNCISFALDMISHLHEKHGIDLALSVPKIV